MDSPDFETASPDVDVDFAQDEPHERQNVTSTKRRRIARACDLCRKKKIKCDGKLPSCSHCLNSRTDCIFTVVEKKPNPPKGAKYIEGLESRLKRMESLLQQSGLLGDDPAPASLPRPTNPNTTPVSRPDLSLSANRTPLQSGSNSKTESNSPALPIDCDSPQNAPNEEEDAEVEALTKHICSLVTDDTGESHYIGSSSGFSFLSPRGMQWVNEQVGTLPFQDIRSQKDQLLDNASYLQSPYFSGVFSRRIFQPLPPRDEVYSLVHDFFAHHNHMIPLYHEATFVQLLDKHYSRDPPKSTSWWASLNIVIALSCILRIQTGVGTPALEAKSRGYFKNAFSVATELATVSRNTLSIEALVAMSFFLMTTSRMQVAAYLVSSAVRIAHSVGLHQRGSDFGLDSFESEQRKRIFWVVYILDKDISIRAGWPSSIDDDDMNVELPTKAPVDNSGVIVIPGGGMVNIFLLCTTISILQSRIYRSLYTVKASKQSPEQLLETITVLNDSLDQWAKEIPTGYGPGDNLLSQTLSPYIIQCFAYLHLTYFHCKSAIHRVAINRKFWTNNLKRAATVSPKSSVIAQISKGAEICVSNARSIIQLINLYSEQLEYPLFWIMLHFLVEAMATLFINLLQNAHHPQARSDLKLMNLVVSYAKRLTNHPDEANKRELYLVCLELARLSKDFLERSDRTVQNRKRRSSNEMTEHPSAADEKEPHPSGSISAIPPEKQAGAGQASLPSEMQGVIEHIPDSVFGPHILPSKNTTPWLGESVMLPSEFGRNFQATPPTQPHPLAFAAQVGHHHQAGSRNVSGASISSFSPSVFSPTFFSQPTSVGPTLQHEGCQNGIFDGTQPPPQFMNFTSGPEATGVADCQPGPPTSQESNLLSYASLFSNVGDGGAATPANEPDGSGSVGSLLSSVWQMPLMPEWNWNITMAAAEFGVPEGAGPSAGAGTGPGPGTGPAKAGGPGAEPGPGSAGPATEIFAGPAGDVQMPSFSNSSETVVTPLSTSGQSESLLKTGGD